jgi:protein phosphatase
MRVELPDPSLVVLIGASGSGKSSFARKHFAATEVISSDFCRGLVADDENDQSATEDAFAVLQFIASRRLAQPRFTVIDATNVQREARRPLIDLANRHDLFPVAIVLDTPESICQERNRGRPDRSFGPHVVERQRAQLHKSLRGLQREGFRRVTVLKTPDEVEAVEIQRTPLWTDRRAERGPFDIIGDVHGCHPELVSLLGELGYGVGPDGLSASPPEGRRAVFVGDYVDRGPDTPSVLRLVMNMTAAGHAICVPGNHDAKLVRKLQGRDVKVTHGLGETLAQLAPETDQFRDEVREFLRGLVSHVVLDDGELVVAHAGMKQAYQGRSSSRVRDFALFGETTGETDEFGLPVRLPWASEYRGRAAVVYGHTPIATPEWINNTINIDTGCVFGGKLTALRWPERDLVSVPAARTYYEPARPFLPAEGDTGATDERPDFVLDVGDIAGKRIVETRLARTVTVPAENAAAAMEIMSRFAIDPRWLIYLPPTMAPTATSDRPDVLEYPSEAFGAYASAGVPTVICEEKHMGSRAIVVLCREASVAASRFGVATGETGAIYTRTGRAFFDTASGTEAVLGHLRAAADRADLWSELHSDWLLLDCELLPWSAKAGELLEAQYAPLGSSAKAALASTIEVLEQAAARDLDVEPLVSAERNRLANIDRYTDAYRRYAWPVHDVADLRVAPFHVLAAERAVFLDRGHSWHLEICDRLVTASPDFIRRTDRMLVELGDEAVRQRACAWWEALTAAGGEGMVVKPLDFTVTGDKGLIQPGLKCRGREYLRLIYGPEYTDADQIDRLRTRSLGRKRSLAIREFALGAEAIERFTRRDPLYRVHECVFGILALESEAVDPRL